MINKNSSDIFKVFYILATCLIVILIYVAAALNSKVSEENQIISLIADCYEEQDQCGLHNIIEESEYEDGSIQLVMGWLENNTHNLHEDERQKGIRVVTYLQACSYDDRSEILSKAFEIYRRRELP